MNRIMNNIPMYPTSRNFKPLYPLDAFPVIVHDAALEMQRNVKAPDALIAMAFLTGISVVGQQLIDVRLPTGQIRPTSLNLGTIAESGERKSAVEGLVLKPIVEHEAVRQKRYKIAIKRYNIRLRYWKSVQSGINRKISAMVQKGESAESLLEELEDNAEKLPIKPRERRTVRQNITEKAIMEALQGDGESIALISDEGEIILKSSAMRHTGFLNRCWDGGDLYFDRADAESLVARHPRLSVSFMVQQGVFQDFLKQHGGISRGSGHWARYLIGWPDSTQGMRFMAYEDVEWMYLPTFHARLTELIEEYDRMVEAGDVKRTVVDFSEDAKRRWIDMANTTESWLQPCGYLSDIKDFASKAMEIAGRVAALLHLFSKQSGNISLDTLNRALAIVEWHLHEFKRIFSPEAAVQTDQVDANALRKYFQTNYGCNGFMIAPKNAVLNNGPVRPIKRLNAALDYLAMLGQIRIVEDAKRKRFIELRPQFFGPLVRM